jgi:hypothetical protein
MLALGCRNGAAPAEPSNVEDALPPDSAEALERSGARDEMKYLGEAPAANPSEALVDQPAANPSEALFADPAEPAKTLGPARDLAADLRAALGSPADCLRDYRPASATTIRVEISALVRPDGMLIEPRASGGGLSTNDLRCVEQRVGDVTLLPLDGEASERVSTFVNIEYEPPPVEEYDVGAPPPKLEDVVQPLPKKKPIPPSGKPIEGPSGDRIDGPSGVPIEGPKGVPIEGPEPKPIEGY